MLPHEVRGLPSLLSIRQLSINVNQEVTTFGLSGGVGTDNEAAGYLNAMRFQNVVGIETLSKLEILVDDTTPAGNIRLGVYADNNGTPGNRLLDAGSVTLTNGWVSKSGLSMAVTQNIYYWLVFDLKYNNSIKYQNQ